MRSPEFAAKQAEKLATITALVNERLTVTEIARRINVSTGSVCNFLKAHGLKALRNGNNDDWTPEKRESRSAVLRKAAEEWSSRYDCGAHGKLTRRQIQDRFGLNKNTVSNRITSGLRGMALVARVDRTPVIDANELLELLGTGKSYREIARRFGCHINTVINTCGKLGVYGWDKTRRAASAGDNPERMASSNL